MMEITRLYSYATQNNKWFICIISLKCVNSLIIKCFKAIQNTMYCLRFPRMQTICTISCIKFLHTVGFDLTVFCPWIYLFSSSSLVPGTLENVWRQEESISLYFPWDNTILISVNIWAPPLGVLETFQLKWARACLQVLSISALPKPTSSS